ncbi:MAG: LysM peptidoglycan-binding domain-containing protein [Saprospiraceae bacterium]|nr:LysM peptidoglycan-binding domain-containing protein [Saprospiraceae bacterium]
MKNLLLTVIALCSLVSLATAQVAPAYVLFGTNCMKQLEYRYTRTGAPLYAYSVQTNPDEQFIFWSGGSGLPTGELPVGTFDCSNLRLNDEVVKIINDQPNTRQLYVILQQPSSGYVMMPIYSATQIKRYGQWYLVVGQKYTFAIDTTKLSYQDNLQSDASQTIIRFAGSQLANCRYQWRFNGEPARGFTERTNFDFIYGIGIVNSRIGATAADLEQNEIRLNSVNGVGIDQYLASICPYSDVINSNTTPSWTTPPGYNTSKEPDKENANVGGNNQITGPTANTGGTAGNAYNPYNCPTPPGKGYHIVQRGESLKAISRTYNVDLKSLINWNGIKNPDHIEVCQQIWVQKPPASAKPPATSTTPKGNTAPASTGPTVQNQSIYWGGNYQGTQQTFNQQQPPNTTAPTSGTRIHVVQKGETLYGISKRYVCPEECVRRANNFALEGSVALQAGQQIVIPDCTCQLPSSSSTTPRTPATYGPPPTVSNVLTPANTPPQGYQPDISPNYGGFSNPAATPAAATNLPSGGVTDASPTAPGTPGELPPTQEYIVRQGETMNSIAIKFKMNVAELAALNSVQQDEKLTPGRRIVVRKY